MLRLRRESSYKCFSQVSSKHSRMSKALWWHIANRKLAFTHRSKLQTLARQGEEAFEDGIGNTQIVLRLIYRQSLKTKRYTTIC